MDLLNIKNRRLIIALLFCLTALSAVMMPLTPWTLDGWFFTQYRFIGSFPGADNPTPISGPAVFFWMNHLGANAVGLDLAGEMYVASLAQNALIFLSSCLLYGSCIQLGMRRSAAPVAVGFLLFTLSTGVPQAFWSENLVIFLFSAVLYLSVKMYVASADAAFRPSWPAIVVVSVLTSVLVVTRVTPILLVPGFAFLFYRRFEFLVLARYLAAMTAVIVMVLGLAIAANYVRFGRPELTNSTGRHLWQSVTRFSDEALASSPDYITLKSIDPEIEGKKYFEIQFPASMQEFHGEQVLKSMAFEAIANEPVLFVEFGLKKFLTTIGAPPYRLAFYPKDPNWVRYDPMNAQMTDPLQTDNPLPSLSVATGAVPPVVEAAAYSVHTRVFWASQHIYPLIVFFVIISYMAFWLRAVDIPGALSGETSRFPLKASAFFVLGAPFAVVMSLGWDRDPAVAGSCLVLLLGLSVLVHRAPVFGGGEFSKQLRGNGALLTFMVLIFFGSLWLSWQVEDNNPRNVLPYLPFLALTSGLACECWVDAFESVHQVSERASRVAAQPAQTFR
jgi:hypothetical protein